MRGLFSEILQTHLYLKIGQVTSVPPWASNVESAGLVRSWGYCRTSQLPADMQSLRDSRI